MKCSRRYFGKQTHNTFEKEIPRELGPEREHFGDENGLCMEIIREKIRFYGLITRLSWLLLGLGLVGLALTMTLCSAFQLHPSASRSVLCSHTQFLQSLAFPALHNLFASSIHLHNGEGVGWCGRGPQVAKTVKRHDFGRCNRFYSIFIISVRKN